MNDKPNPTQNFLISAISWFLGDLLRPVRYVMRSHMGIQHSALIPILASCPLYGAGFWYAATFFSEVNKKVVILYAVLILVGYFRNADQANQRRRVRDWGVNTWSSGESLWVPVLLFTCRRVYRRWGSKPVVRRLLGKLLTADFVYYVAEPVTLLLASAALWSIGSSLYLYPVILAIAFVVVRNDAKLWLYLKAHEIPDGKMLERAVKSEFEGPVPGAGVMLAQLSTAPVMRGEIENESVFDRLNPELQSLLLKDRFGHSQPRA